MSGFGRILEDLDEAEVAYVLVGGIAMIRHGVVRATRDIDGSTEFPRRSARWPTLWR